MGPSMNLGNQFGDNINASLKVKTIGEIVKSSSFKLIDQFYNVTSDSPRMPLVCWAATEWVRKCSFTIRTTTCLTSGDFFIFKLVLVFVFVIVFHDQNILIIFIIRPSSSSTSLFIFITSLLCVERHIFLPYLPFSFNQACFFNPICQALAATLIIPPHFLLKLR